MLAKVILTVAAAGVMACGASSTKGQAEGAQGQTTNLQAEQEQKVVQVEEPASSQVPETATDQPVSQPQPPKQEGEKQQTQQQSRQTMTQGIKGRIIFRQGDFMPSPDAPAQGNGRGVKRELYIHELTSMGQVQGEPPFYQQIQTNLVQKVVSDENGTFKVELKPGKYSLFVKEKDGYYANLFDGQNNIYPVEVKEDQVTDIEFIIDHQATY